jgi:nucleoside-diphosphate-sugar epimerase
MTRKIIITGAAGLVGQNLIARLKEQPDLQLVGIDKHPTNTAMLRRMHPEIEVIEADLAKPGPWTGALTGADALVLNQAQIGGLVEKEFVDNNVTATKLIVEAMREHAIPYFVHISSSVVNSKADDFYTRSKTTQEKFIDSVADIPHVVLRPTLMFGWFDRKHLGWLRRFMDRTAVFPIPGNGKFIRQPLYVGDLAAIIVSSLASRATGTYDISGREQIYYGDLIKLIHDIVKPRAKIVHIPYSLFWMLLFAYAKFSSTPPFTTSQLEALVIPETFPVIDWDEIFGIKATSLREAMTETYLDPRYAGVVLDF